MATMHARVPGLFAALMVLAAPSMLAQPPVTKARVADLIVKVENGVDEFRNYLEKRGENAKDAANSTAGKRRTRTATSSQKAKAETKKDELDDALGSLNRSTNRLRRKFDATDTWIETKSEVEHMMDDGRKINQLIARGSYGTEAARLWGVLRTGMNDLARVYGVPLLAI
jgi:hypothetical protein